MIFDDEIIPEHNLVSSEWEKNERIRVSYHRARFAIIPKLIDLLETHFGDRVWVASNDIFHTPIPSELWSRPEYRMTHAASSSSSGSGSSANKINNDDDSGNNNISSSGMHGTTTEFFLEKQQQGFTKRSSCSGSKTKTKAKPKKGLSDKCLLRHEFSTGCFSFMVCKLQRRHQKEIAKHPPRGSSSSLSQPTASSAVLEGLARSAVLKQYTKLSKNYHLPSSGKGQSNTETIETSAKDTSEEAKTSDDNAEADANGDTRNQPSVLQEEASTIVTDALSIVRAAKNLQVGVVPVTTLVRWKAEEEFEIRYFD